MKLSETLFQESNGRIFESVTFSNGITDYFYSDYLHKIIQICNSWGLDFDNYNDFQVAQSKYVPKSYLQPV